MTAVALGNIALNLAGGYVSSYGLDMTTPNIPLRPPNIIFPIVWTTLYVMLGVLAGRLYRSGREWLIFWYYIHLSLNFLWSILFFGLKWRELSAVVIASMICIMIYILSQRPDQNVIILSYISWLAFALYLNIASIGK